MKKINLSQGKVALVDDEDYEMIMEYNWCANYDGHNYYAVNSKLKLRMHRIIMKAQKWQIVDHKNGNTLDNQKANLRIATGSQNHANRIPNKRGYSKYLGVYATFRHLKKTGKQKIYWNAQLIKDGKKYRLGIHKTEEDAALAYNEAAIKHHGEFARLNILR